MLENLQARIKNLNIELMFEDNVKTALAEIGFDAVYGARPLRREIQNKIEDALSEKILDKSINNGDKVVCSYEDGEFKFEIRNA